MPRKINIWGRTSSAQLLICLAIGLAGCLAIYNATFHVAEPFHFVSRQLVWLSLSIAVLFICSRIPPTSYEKWTYPLAGLVIVTLYLLLFFEADVNGVQRGIRIDTKVFDVLYIQPAEIGKPIFVLFLAKALTTPYRLSRIGFLGFARYFIPSLAWVVPILLNSNFSSFLVYVVTFSVMFWLQGAKFIHVLLLLVVWCSLLTVEIRSEPAAKSRFVDYFGFTAGESDTGVHSRQLKTVLASGGLWGRQPEQTFWSRHYLPLGYSDSAFATLGETIGFMGAVPIVLGIVLWFFCCIFVARKRKYPRDAMIISGISTMIVAQAYIHISVTLGIFPPVGMPLPMFSYGGSSLVSTMASIGIILSLVNKRRKDVEIVDQ